MFAVQMRSFIEVVNQMMAAKRILGYTNLDLEDDLVKQYDSSPDLEGWPRKGEIEFKNVTMKYREHLEPSLDKVNFKVGEGMKVGIVGRTGAGKSSILHSLFRLTEIEEESSVEIDGVNTKHIGLHLLRKNIAFIP
mmetsp:Transcript_9288/g.8751  ORF Transcript_9288/g.8751 Transcript_9288/m.8751 type:complete len:136 (-) Transcript_9288:590-997(-)